MSVSHMENERNQSHSEHKADLWETCARYHLKTLQH